jgi:hypothetical protein
MSLPATRKGRRFVCSPGGSGPSSATDPWRFWVRTRRAWDTQPSCQGTTPGAPHPRIRPLACSDGKPCVAALPQGADAIGLPPSTATARTATPAPMLIPILTPAPISIDPARSPPETPATTSSAPRAPAPAPAPAEGRLQLRALPDATLVEAASDRSGVARFGPLGLTLRQSPAPDSNRPWR